MPRFEEFEGRDYSDLTLDVAWFAAREDEEIDIGVIREDGDVIGSSLVVNGGDYSILRYLEIDKEHRGTKLDGRSLAGVLTERTLDFIPDDRDVYAQGTNMSGKTQHLMQNNGFELSGLGLDKNRGEIVDDPSGGFKAEFWSLANDEDIEAYVPEELQGFIDASLSDQRDITYLEPDKSELYGASMDIITTAGRIAKTDISQGDVSLTRIKEELSVLESINNWAEVVNIDVTEPFAYELSSDLFEAGYRPVNMTPEVVGNRLRMAKLGEDVGIYGLTPETMDVMDEAGLNYNVLEEYELSNKVVFES